MDLAMIVFGLGILSGLIFALPAIISLRRTRSTWKIEALELRSVRANDSIRRKYERDLLAKSRDLSSRLKNELISETGGHLVTMQRLRDEKEKCENLTIALCALKDEVSCLKKRNESQQLIIEFDANRMNMLKMQVVALRGVATQRAKRLGKCFVFADCKGKGFYTFAKGAGVVGPSCETKWEARRKFEAIMGLRGKIEWEDNA